MNKIPNPEMPDAENPEWTEEMFQNAVRFQHLPASLQTKLRAVRNVPPTPTKVSTTLHLSQEVIHYFKSEGKGWQNRIDAALLQFIAGQRKVN